MLSADICTKNGRDTERSITDIADIDTVNKSLGKDLISGSYYIITISSQTSTSPSTSYVVRPILATVIIRTI